MHGWLEEGSHLRRMCVGTKPDELGLTVSRMKGFGSMASE